MTSGGADPFFRHFSFFAQGTYKKKPEIHMSLRKFKTKKMHKPPLEKVKTKTHFMIHLNLFCIYLQHEMEKINNLFRLKRNKLYFIINFDEFF